MNPKWRILVVCWLLTVSLPVAMIAEPRNIQGMLTGIARAVDPLIDVASDLFLAYDMETRLSMSGKITSLTLASTVNGSAAAAFSQGIATDGTYFYSNRLTGGHFYVTKYNAAFTEVAAHDATNDGPAGTTQVNSVFILQGVAYYGATNYPTSPAQSWVFMYRTSDLAFLGVHALSGPQASSFWGEGGCYNFASNTWWLVGNAVQPMEVWQYDSSWNYLTAYSFYVPLASGTPGPPGGYLAVQGCRWDAGLFYVTIHDAVPGSGYLHAYQLVGGRLQYVMAVRASVPGTDCCGQGFELTGSKAYFAYRVPYDGLKIFTIYRGYTNGASVLNVGPMSDLSGNGRVGNMTWTTLENGRFGGATRFESLNDGSNTTPDTIEVLPDSTWQEWTAISVSLWARTQYQGDQALAGVFAGGTNGEWLLSFLAVSSEVRWSVINQASSRVDVFYAGFNYHDAQWHQYGGTWDGSTARLWIDGLNVANLSLAGHLKSYSTPFYIGRYAPSTGSFYLNGSVDQLVLYKDRALNATTMAYLAGVDGTDITSKGFVILPPSAADAFSAVLDMLSPFFGGSTEAAGIILSLAVIMALAVLVSIALPKLVEGPGIFIPVGLGMVLAFIIGWFPLWAMLFSALILVFVIVDPLGMREAAASGGGGGG